jgi:membrane-associated protein
MRLRSAGQPITRFLRSSSGGIIEQMAPLHISAGVGYVGLAAIVGAESAGIPVPGETSLIAAAVLASQGHLSLPLVIVVAAGAAIVGDNLGYLLGRRGGRWLLKRPGWAEDRREQLLERGEVFFERHGGKAVFLARWLPWLRATAAWLAGASRMRWPRFLLWNALGGVAWATSIGLAAYLFGKAAATAIGAAGIVLLALAVVVAVGAFFVYRPRGNT